MQTGNIYEKQLGYSQISGLTSAKGLGLIPPGAKLILIQPEAQGIRWRDDGPSTTPARRHTFTAPAKR